MPLSRRSAAFGLAALAGLAACRSAPLPPRAAPIDFSAFPPIVLNVAAIDVVDSHRPATGAVDGQVATPPAEAASIWARQRLQAGGQTGRARVTVTEASLIAEALPVSGGVKGLFTNEQATRYNGRLTVEISAEGQGEGTIRAKTFATATATATASEKSSPIEREAIMRDVVRTLAEALNARLDAGVRKDLARLVIR
jgi:hypothetical protein